MLRPRPYSGLSTAELKAMADMGSAGQLDDIIHELGFRSRPAAKELLAALQGNSGGDGSRNAAAGGPTVYNTAPGGGTHQRNSRASEVRGPAFPPTDEQREAIAAFSRGGSLMVTAFAGAGKTSTLQFMAAQRHDRGIYLAFNRAIAEEARTKFPPHVDSRTTHSVAARHVRGHHSYSNAKLVDRLSANQLASILDLKRTKVDQKVSLTPTQIAFLFLSTVRKFASSAATEIAPEHVPMSGRLLGLDQQAHARVTQWIVEHAKQLWLRMIDSADELPLGHDGYLKLWSLSNPKLDFSFILLDEAQDTNPVVLHVLAQQTHAQMVYIGDAHQQIYEWRGAINAMQDLRTDHDVRLTQSFRFGPAIAEAATRVLRTLGETQPLRGNDKISSRVLSGENARAILARTNSMVISEALAALSRDQRPNIVGGTQELQALVQDVYSLMQGEPGSRPEFFGFTTWDEVVAFAATDEGEEIRPFVTLVQQNGPGRLWAAITNSVADENRADVVISTAHKAKGREWPSVRIADDFASSRTREGQIPASEARLFYVAITRAKETLSVDSQLLESFCTGCVTERK